MLVWKLSGETVDMVALQKIRSVADYQFGRNTGKKLFPDTIKIVYSKNTGKIRHIHLQEELLATLRPTTGLLILTVAGAKHLIREVSPPRCWVKVDSDAEPFVMKGRSAFAKHVIDADPTIRPNTEVIVINKKSKVLAVGRAILTGTEMKQFNRGMAVRVRRGVTEKS
jgi:predicted RNA-binding protein (TIGR00451 family)